MKLFRYNQFLGLNPINENVAKAKSYLKEFYLVGIAAKQLGFITEDMEWDIKEGRKRVFTMKDFTPEQQSKITNKIKGRGEYEGKGIRLNDDEVRKIESSPEFKLVREITVEKKNDEGKVVKAYQLDRDNAGWVSHFTWFYFVDNQSKEQLQSLYERLIDYKDLLDKLPRKFDANFIDETIPNPEHNHTNAEDLSDELDKLKKFRQLAKVKASLPSHLKKALEEASELQLEEMYEIAQGFDEFQPEDKKELVWKGFFGEMQKDTLPTLPNGQPNPNFGKVRHMSRLGLIRTLNDFIKSAKGHLKGSATSGYASWLEKINKTSDKFGKMGANIVYNENGIMVVKVYSYAANNFLNQGVCSHCIVDRGSQYWDSYVGDRNAQYYVYNFNMPNTNPNWAIGVTIKPDRTWSSGACQNKNNSYIGGEFKTILKNWQKEYSLDVDIYSDILNPITKEELEKVERAKTASREIVKKGLTIEQIKRYVTEDGADINKDNGRALINAIEEDDIEKVKYILELGGNPNLKKDADAAISNSKSLDMIKLLVSHGADMTGHVIKHIIDKPDALEYCLKAGLDPDFDRQRPFREVTKGSYKSKTELGESYLESFKLLIKYGANIYVGGKTMIIKWCSEYGRKDCIDYLYSTGVKFTKAEIEDAITFWLQHSRRMPQDKIDDMIEYLRTLETK